MSKKKNDSITLIVMAFCWFAIFMEGYDLIVFGVVLPYLMDPSVWGLTSTQAGAMGSYALLGMFFGSIIGGYASDKFGRKNVLIISFAFMTIMMLLTALTDSPNVFGLLRFLAGVGIGGVVPAAAALTTEYTPPRKRSFFFVIMYSSFAIGAVVAALFGVSIIEKLGWRSLFWIGAIPIVVVPLYMWKLPESVQYLQSSGQTEKANKLIEKYQLNDSDLELNLPQSAEKTSSASLFKAPYLMPTILFSLAYIMAFLLVYGMNTWLPQIMRQAGYPINSSIMFLLAFNLGAIVGGIMVAKVADRLQPRKVIGFTYFLAAVSIGLLSFKLNTVMLYLLIVLAGFGTTGSTFIMASYVLKLYDAKNRGSAIGFTSAIGRFGAVAGPVVVGFIMSFDVSYKASFYLFAVIALLASIIVVLVPNPDKESK